MNVSRILILFFVFFVIDNTVLGQNTPPPSMSVSLSASDTSSMYALGNEANYAGFRLQLTDIRQVKTSKKSIKFKSTLTNTGRMPVNLGKLRKGGEPLPVILLDEEGLNAQGLAHYHDQIRYAVLQVSVSLAEGKSLGELNIEVVPIANDRVITAAKTPLPAQNPIKPAEKTTNPPVLTTKPTMKTEVVAPKPSEVLKPDSVQFVGSKVLPVDTVLPTGFVSFEDAEREISRLDSLEKAKQNLENEEKKARDTKHILKPVSKTKEQLAQEEKLAAEKVAAAQKKEKTPPPQYNPPVTVKKDTTPPKSQLKNESKSDFVEEKIDLSTGCGDLVLDGVRLIERTEKSVKVEVSIFNNGNKDINIYGATKSLDDNVAVRFFSSGTPRLTRGSLPVDGIYLNDGLKASKGILEPKKSFKQTLKIPAEKFNRFNKILLIQIDGFDVIRECDETNNVNYLILDY